MTTAIGRGVVRVVALWISSRIVTRKIGKEGLKRSISAVADTRTIAVNRPAAMFLRVGSVAEKLLKRVKKTNGEKFRMMGIAWSSRFC